LTATRAWRSGAWGDCDRSATRRLDVLCTEVGQRGEVNDHERALRRPGDGTSGSPATRAPKFVSFILTLGGVVPPGASRDYFVARQNLAGVEIGQSLDPTVPRGEIDPGEFE
jgi:hypothetical protein